MHRFVAPSYTSEPVHTHVVLSPDRLEPAGQAVHAVLLPSPYEFAGHATHPLMSAAGAQYVFNGQHRVRPPVVHWGEPDGQVTEPHEAQAASPIPAYCPAGHVDSSTRTTTIPEPPTPLDEVAS